MTPGQERDLLAHRLIQAEGALRDARILLTNGGEPRGVKNRAYYAAFYAALALLQTAGKAPKSHQGVVSLLGSEFVKPGRLSVELSHLYRELFRDRLDSDYQTIDPIPMAEAEEAVIAATAFVHAIRNMLAAREIPGDEKAP